MRMVFRPELMHAGGIMHGGAIASLLDSVLVPAIGSALPEGSRYSTVDLHVQYMEALVDDDAVAEGWVVRRGRPRRVRPGRGPGGEHRSARRHERADLQRQPAPLTADPGLTHPTGTTRRGACVIPDRAAGGPGRPRTSRRRGTRASR